MESEIRNKNNTLKNVYTTAKYIENQRDTNRSKQKIALANKNYPSTIKHGENIKLLDGSHLKSIGRNLFSNYIDHTKCYMRSFSRAFTVEQS